MSEVVGKQERARESIHRRRSLISDPEIARRLVMLIQQEEPSEEETSWYGIRLFSVKVERHLQEHPRSQLFLDTEAAAVGHAASGEPYPEQHEIEVHPQVIRAWTWEPTRLTEPFDPFESASEMFGHSEMNWSPQADFFSRNIEAMLWEDVNTSDMSEPNGEEPEHTLESDEAADDHVTVSEESDAELVLKALENPKFDWRTIPGLVEETGLDAETVANALSEFNGVVVKSSRYTTDGRALYTTRSRYEEFAPLWRKILGAVKNQID